MVYGGTQKLSDNSAQFMGRGIQGKLWLEMQLQTIPNNKSVTLLEVMNY